MCGLAGLLLERRPRSPRTMRDISEAFTRLLILSEHRGPHATGVAWVNAASEHMVFKHPMPAREFVQTPDYITWLNALDGEVTCLLGHTRWPTRGTIHNPANNHPIICPPVLLTHNGSILDFECHFQRMSLPRQAQVDSELLARMAQRHASEQGIDVEAFLHHLSALDGRMSLAMVTTTLPTMVILLKGNMPLEVWHHHRRGLVAYASEERILRMALPDKGWQAVDVEAGHGLVYDTNDLRAMRHLTFDFACLRRPASDSDIG